MKLEKLLHNCRKPLLDLFLPKQVLLSISKGWSRSLVSAARIEYSGQALGAIGFQPFTAFESAFNSPRRDGLGRRRGLYYYQIRRETSNLLGQI